MRFTVPPHSQRKDGVKKKKKAADGAVQSIMCSLDAAYGLEQTLFSSGWAEMTYCTWGGGGVGCGEDINPVLLLTADTFRDKVSKLFWGVESSPLTVQLCCCAHDQASLTGQWLDVPPSREGWGVLFHAGVNPAVRRERSKVTKSLHKVPLVKQEKVEERASHGIMNYFLVDLKLIPQI